MAKRKKDAITCTVCSKEVPLGEYAAHVQKEHSSPQQPAAPVSAPSPAPAQAPPQNPYAPQPAQVPPMGSVTPTAPPPMGQFINGQSLYALGGKLTGIIRGVRLASGGRPEFASKTGFFLDIDSGGTMYTGRVGTGDTRHHFLWKKFGQNWVGQSVTARLSTPNDLDPRGRPTRAVWVLE